MSSLALISRYYKKHALALTLGFIALIGCDLSQLIIPKVVGRAIDSLADPSFRRGDLWNYVIFILALAAAVALLRFSWRRLIVGFSRLVEKEIRGRLYQRMVRLSPKWHQANSTGDLMALATNDIEAVRMAISFGFVSLTDAVVMGLSAILFMLSISPELTLWALLPMPLITILTRIFGRRIYKTVLSTQDIFGKLTEVVREQISGLKVIRAMGLAPLAIEEADRAGRLYLDKNVRLSLLTGLFFPFLTLLTNLSVALVLYFGGRESITGSISTGDFVAFISYLGLLSWPMMALGLTFGLLQQGLASLDRLKRVLSAEGGEELNLAKPTYDDAQPGEITVEVNNLSFVYPGRQEAALKDLTLTMKPGRIMALVGPTGSGKSTLAALLPGLREAPLGTISVNGRFVEDWPLDQLRSLFGYVPQEAFMFSGTIFDNVSFGRPGAAEGEVLAAMRDAGLMRDIDNMPSGLETMVGERGITLSGGQRQRLALARALLINPPFLIMDDTLSAVDAGVEDEILKSIIEKRRGLSTLIISHRVTTLHRADHIFVLQDGKLTEEGTWDELLAHDGGYFKRIYELTLAAQADEDRLTGR